MMRLLISTAAMVLTCSAIATMLANSRPAFAGDDEVIQADRAWTEALEMSDQQSARKLEDADFSWIDQDGIMWSKEDALQAELKPLVGTGSEVKVSEHKYGNVVLVQQNDGNKYAGHFWVRRADGWRLLHTIEVAVRKRDFKTVEPTYDIPCINPCKEVPYKALTENEKGALAGWQEQESSPAGWDKRVADAERAVHTYGGLGAAKADRIATRNRQAQSHPNAPSVGSAPVLWMRMWDFGDAVVAIMCQPTYGDKPYWASRIFAKNNGIWQMAESYHSWIQAAPVMTAPPSKDKSSE